MLRLAITARWFNGAIALARPTTYLRQMQHADLAAQILAAWERRDELSPASKGADIDAIEAALDLLDTGQARVAPTPPRRT